MAYVNKNDSNLSEELSKVNSSLYENSIELWRIEEKCRMKIESIKNIENSTIQVNTENEHLENQLQITKSKIEEVKKDILCMDKIIHSFYETLAHLDVECKKKEFSLNKSKNEYELQFFIRMELWQKEEKRFDSIPEVKSLKIADKELNDTKLEYEELLDCEKKLIEKIKKAEEQNNEKLNDIVVKFAKVYVEMLTLNKREENCRTLLKKLNIEFNEKMNMKTELLKSQKKKTNKISFWTQSHGPFDSKIIDVKLDLMNQELKPNSKYSNSCDFPNLQKLDNEDILISNNKLKKKVTFLLPSEDQTFSTNNDILNNREHENTNLEVQNLTNHDMNSNSSLRKNDTVVNMDTTQQYQNNFFIEPLNMNIDDDEKLINEHNFDFQTNKRKIAKKSSHFEFKKPYNPVQQENQTNRKSFQPSPTKNENIHIKKNFNGHQEKVQSSNSFANHYKHEDSLNDIHLQKKSSLKSAEQSNLKSPSNENNSLYELQSNETSSEPNKIFSSLFLNEYNEQGSQDSWNSSLCGSELSELFENSYNSNQYPDLQLNFSNPFNTNSKATSESNLQELNMKNQQQPGNQGLQQHKYEPFKEMFSSKASVIGTTSTTSTNLKATSKSNLQELNMKNQQQSGNQGLQQHKFEPFKEMFSNNASVIETTTTASSYSTEPIRPLFSTSKQFRYNFI